MRGTAFALGAATLGGLVLVGVAANLSSGFAPQALEAVPAARPRPPPSPLGLRVVALDADAARARGIAGGVSVVHAIGQSYASGLRVADVIVEVNGRPVASADAFWDAVAAANFQPMLRVLREGKPLSIRIDAAEPMRAPPT
jgi:S1-C subfamily serine protease